MTPPNPERVLTPAAFYRRVSTDKQEGSLEVQERNAIRYAEFKGLRLDDDLVFSDPDTSGRTPMLKRKGGFALIERLRMGDVHHVVVAKLDRLGRNVVDAINTIEFFKENKIILHIADFGGDAVTMQGHFGRMVLTVMLAVAEWEVAEIRDRTSKEMRKRFDQMKLTGNVPFGYDARYVFEDGFVYVSNRALSFGKRETAIEPIADSLVRAHGQPLDCTLMDNPLEQDTIRQIARLRNGRWKYADIALLLNQNGHKTKQGRPWQQGNVHSVLNNRYTARLLQQTAARLAA